MNRFTILCACAAAGMFALNNSAASAPISGAKTLTGGALSNFDGTVEQVGRRHRHRHRHARYRRYYGYGYSPYAYYGPGLFFGFGGGHHGGHGFGHGGHGFGHGGHH